MARRLGIRYRFEAELITKGSPTLVATSDIDEKCSSNTFKMPLIAQELGLDAGAVPFWLAEFS